MGEAGYAGRLGRGRLVWVKRLAGSSEAGCEAGWLVRGRIAARLRHRLTVSIVGHRRT